MGSARTVAPPAAARPSHLVRVAATQAALTRVRGLDLEMYRRLVIDERAQLVADYRTRRQPLPPKPDIDRKARRRTLRRMAAAFPDPYATYRREELAARGITT